MIFSGEYSECFFRTGLELISLPRYLFMLNFKYCSSANSLRLNPSLIKENEKINPMIKLRSPMHTITNTFFFINLCKGIKKSKFKRKYKSTKNLSYNEVRLFSYVMV